MRIATWNVNSLTARLPRVEEWIAYARPDVLCLQETKQADAAFPHGAFAALGYESAHHGDGRWNGVAILSRVGLDRRVDRPRVLRRRRGHAADRRRLRRGTGALGLRPERPGPGRPPLPGQAGLVGPSPRSCSTRRRSPDRPVAVCGDFNVAPEDRDVWDPSQFEGMTHVSPAERAALADLESWGLVDAFRRQYPDDQLFSWWDYRGGSFHRHRGMRIDLILVTEGLARNTTLRPHRPAGPQGREAVGPHPGLHRYVDPADVRGTPRVSP